MMKSINFLNDFRTITFLIALILIGCDHPATQLREVPMMGDLSLGEHGVGYRTLFEYDRTRPAVPYSDWDGKIYPNYKAALGRQFQIHVWYPASVESGELMKYDQYVQLMGRETDFEFTEEQRDFAKERFIQQTNDLGGNGHFTEKELQLLLEMEVLAQYEAEPLQGTFPVVVFPSGSSAAYHSITAEFLASHGFVVVGFSPKGRFSWGMENSTIGLETAVYDLEFVVQKIGLLPFVNLKEITLVGNAISASVCALAVARNSQYKGLVSLEGGLPSTFEQRLLDRTEIYEPQNIQVPTLFIYAPHPAIDPSYTFHLVHADRYYAHFPNMSEFAMLNYGMFDAFVPDIIGEHEGGTKGGFEAANELLLGFLKMVHFDSVGSLFEDQFVTRISTHIDTTFFHKAIPAAPNMAELKAIFLRDGIEAIDSIYQNLESNGNPMPFYPSFYRDYRNWLAWKKDPAFDNRLRLYQMAYRSFPESSEVNYYLAAYQERIGDSVLAIHHYQRTLQYLKTDEDPDLSTARKKQIREYTEEALEGLK